MTREIPKTKLQDTRQKYHRRSIRLNGYNYSSNGLYFVTVCAWNRKCLFGEIIEQQIHLNDYGNIVQNEWLKTPMVRLNVALDKFVIMPNHAHGIIILNNVEATRRVASTSTRWSRGPATGSIGAIIGQIKSITTKRINKLRDIPHLPIWQRNYYEHIIRDEGELNRIRQYIIDNPLNWDSDKENPNNIAKTGKR